MSIKPADSKKPASLSVRSAQKINWKAIDDKVDSIVEIRQSGGGACENVADLPPDIATRVEAAFEVSKNEFAKALAQLKWQIIALNWIVIPLAGIAIAVGLILLVTSDSKWPGGLSGSSGLAVMTTAITFTWRLGKDQSLLQLIPSTYETLFRLAFTPQQYCVILQAFRRELYEMRWRLHRAQLKRRLKAKDS
ncbi:hypothetical protein [Frigoriglobus tundricola]|uniref:hypothetical protein n=1 Tax=Frigoriglobus tundricola TaxID=2774151 RepID=UPI00148ED5CF|nr:hypothetical protein [Frigoriglobus tundricola]